ncbi:hypothetical protein D3C71_1842950 [compost metagenome]
MRSTHAEHRLAHQPQAFWRQLQADDEQQQDHAQLGNVRDAFGIADQPQRLRADGHASEQVADHCAELQALGQWNGDDGGEQEDHRGLQKAAFVWHWLVLHELPGQR